MFRRRSAKALIVVFLSFWAFQPGYAQLAQRADPGSVEAPRAAPTLIVAISVDQFSADLFAQYRARFTGGLRRLSGGVVFPSGYQSHAATETCPGHSTILTGSRPNRTGIIANSWYDSRVSREDKFVYCAEDERVPGSSSEHYTVSPIHLRVPTLGEYMAQSNARSRSVIVAGKDRVAIMMGGQNPTQRWWWDGRSFVSHAGVAPTAAVNRANAHLADQLSRPRPTADLPAVCASQDQAIALQGGGNPVGTGRFAREAGNRRSFRASPDFDRDVLDLAAGLTGELHLGEGPATDLLAIGLSATDYVGHTYGTGGSEMCIQLMELDQALGSFFDTLDRSRVDYIVMLTADHGGIDIPERNREQAIPDAVRMDPALNPAAMDQAIATRLGLHGPVLFAEGSEIYIASTLAPRVRRRVFQEAVRAYRTHPQVAAVFTSGELSAAPIPAGPPDTWSLLDRARASFVRDRSGDFVILLRPHVVPIVDTSHGSVTTHGSAWDYDRRVPILFWRAGMTPFEQPLAVETVDIMPSLAALIGLSIPAGNIDGRCLDLLQGPPNSCGTRATSTHQNH